MASIKITRFKNNINNTLGRGIPIRTRHEVGIINAIVFRILRLGEFFSTMSDVRFIEITMSGVRFIEITLWNV